MRQQNTKDSQSWKRTSVLNEQSMGPFQSRSPSVIICHNLMHVAYVWIIFYTSCAHTLNHSRMWYVEQSAAGTLYKHFMYHVGSGITPRLDKGDISALVPSSASPPFLQCSGLHCGTPCSPSGSTNHRTPCSCH